MSDNLKAHVPHIQLLAKPKNDKKLIQVLLNDSQTVCAVCEIIQNALNGNIKYTENEKKCLKKYKNMMYKLNNKKTSSAIKKRLLVQGGSGFLVPLIGPAIAIISSLLAS